MRLYSVLLPPAAAAAALMCPQVALAADSSAANIAQARALLNEGLALREKGSLPEALEKLRAAHELARTPVTAIEVARTYLALGQLVEAREMALSVARIPVTREETGRSSAARRESAKLADELLPRIPTLTVKVSGAAADAVQVTIDGAEVPALALGAPRQVDPGPHDVTAKSAATQGDQAHFTLKEGESREVGLKLAPLPQPAASVSLPLPLPLPLPSPSPPPESAAAPPPEPSRGAPSNTLSWCLLGGGVAVGAAGAVLMGVEVGSASHASQVHDRSAYDRARTAWTLGLVGAIAGGALAASGIVVRLATPARRDAAQASRWIGFDGRELQVGTTW